MNYLFDMENIYYMAAIFINLVFANHAIGPKCFSQGYGQKEGIQIFISKYKYKDNEESTNSSILIIIRITIINLVILHLHTSLCNNIFLVFLFSCFSLYYYH